MDVLDQEELAKAREFRRVSFLEVLRFRRGLSINDAATRMGISDRTLRYYEARGTRHPRLAIAQKIADYYRLSLAEFHEALRAQCDEFEAQDELEGEGPA